VRIAGELGSRGSADLVRRRPRRWSAPRRRPRSPGLAIGNAEQSLTLARAWSSASDTSAVENCEPPRSPNSSEWAARPSTAPLSDNAPRREQPQREVMG